MDLSSLLSPPVPPPAPTGIVDSVYTAVFGPDEPPIPPAADWAADPFVVVALAAAVAIAVLIHFALWQVHGRDVTPTSLSRWCEPAAIVSKFAAASMSIPRICTQDNLSICAACQALSHPQPAKGAAVSKALGSKLRDGARYVKFARAAHGDAEYDDQHAFAASICAHTGLTQTQLLRVEIKTHDDAAVHFVAVEHSAKAVVLAIRGAHSLADVMHDAAAHVTPFCGGKAHALLARMAQALWREAAPTINAALEKYDDYSLVITGHSLGAGIAGLLTILLYHLRTSSEARTAFFPALPPLFADQVPIKSFAYGPPPVFAPLGRAPRGALSNIHIFVLDRDCVPFVSVRALLPPHAAV